MKRDAVLDQTSRNNGSLNGFSQAPLGTSGAPEEESCAPCVARLAVPADRMSAMLAAVDHEPEPIVTPWWCWPAAGVLTAAILIPILIAL